MNFNKLILPVREKWPLLAYGYTIILLSHIGLLQKQHISPGRSATRREARLHLWRTICKVLACVLYSSIVSVLSYGSFDKHKRKETPVNMLAHTKGPLASSILESQRALLRHFDPETLEALAQFLTDTTLQEPTQRSIVLDTLKALRKTSLHDAPMKTLRNGDTSMQIIASEAQSKFGDRALCELSLAFIDAQTNDQWIVRATAVQALGELGEDVPLRLLAIILKSDEDGVVRTAAAHAIGKIKGNVSLELLTSALSDPEWSVREMAVDMLGEYGDRAPLESLIKAVNDEDESVREAAIRALGQLGELVPIDPLLKTLRDKEESVRTAAAQVLWSLGKSAQEALLATAFLDKEGSIAATVDSAIGDVGEFTLAKLLESTFTEGTRRPPEIPLLDLLQELLAQDLIRKNEIESPLWQWCISPSDDFLNDSKADQRSITTEQQKPETINWTRLHNQISHNSRDYKGKKKIEQSTPNHLRDSSFTSYRNTRPSHKSRFRKET